MSESGGGVSKDVDIRLIDPQKLDEEARKLIQFEELVKKKKELESQASGPNYVPNWAPYTGQTNQQTQQTTTQSQQSQQTPAQKKSKGIPLTPEEQNQKDYEDYVKQVKASFKDPEDDSDEPEDYMDFVNARNLAKQKQKFGSITGGIGNFKSFASNPAGFLKGTLMSTIGKAGIAGMVAVFGIETIQEIFELIKGQFGPGGLFDTRKLVLNEVKTVAPLDSLIKIRNGQVFFTDDAGQRLRQGAPELSNTRELRNGHLRYIQLYQGT